jgi:hypothetical protein
MTERGRHHSKGTNMGARAVALTAAAYLAVFATRAAALPAPMSDADLQKNSDVIASVRVLAVACTGQVSTTRDKVPTYQAWLSIVKATKGAVKERETVLVQWQDVPKGIVGPWKVEYFPGEEVTTYLKWDAEKRVYTTTWWNAKGKPTRPADFEEKLPTQPGMVLTMKFGGKEKKKDAKP